MEHLHKEAVEFSPRCKMEITFCYRSPVREPGKALLSVHRMHRVEALGLWTGETIPLAKDGTN